MTRLFDLDFQLLHDTVLAAIAVFVLFLFLSYLLFNPVRKMLEDRKMKIKTDLDTAKLDKEDAAAVGSGKGVVGHHEDGGPLRPVELFKRSPPESIEKRSTDRGRSEGRGFPHHQTCERRSNT